MSCNVSASAIKYAHGHTPQENSSGRTENNAMVSDISCAGFEVFVKFLVQLDSNTSKAAEDLQFPLVSV